jgi:hypothetical protein
MPRYLLTVSDADAARLERWLGFRLIITPGTGVSEPVDIAGLDAITDEEYQFIGRRLSTSGPLYHAGGPSAHPPVLSPPDREAARSELSKLLGALWRNSPVDRGALDEILRAADAYAAAAGGPG